MQITFSSAAIDKLNAMQANNNLAFTDTGVFNDNTIGNGRLCLRTNELKEASYPHEIHTNVGLVKVSARAHTKLGNFSTVDYDHFRNVFVVVRDGQMFDDNLYIQEL